MKSTERPKKRKTSPRLFAVAAVVVLAAGILWIRAHEGDLIVIEGATLIDGTGNPPITDAVIRIDRGVIEAVFRQGERTIPMEASVIDGSGKTVIPGLFDLDTHIGQQGLDAAAQAMSNYLYYGVTTICDSGVTVLQGEGLEKLLQEGKLVGPRILEAGPMFTAVGGYPIAAYQALGRTIDLRSLTQVEDPEAAVKQVQRYVREYQEYRVAMIEAALESGGAPAHPRMTAKTYKALVDEAHRNGLKVYTHGFLLSDIRDALAGGVDLLAHRFSEVPAPDSDIVKTIVKNKVSWLPAISSSESVARLFDHPEIWDDSQVQKTIPARYIGMARDAEILARVRPQLESSRSGYKDTMKTVKLLRDSGANILVGTDSTGAPHRMFYGWDVHREIEQLVNAGMKPMDVIVAASRRAAEFLGKDDKLGTIEPGKSADLIILSENPLEDIRNTRAIDQVIYQGRIIDRGNLALLHPF